MWLMTTDREQRGAAWEHDEDRSDDPERWFAWADDTWERDPLAAHLLAEVGRRLQAEQEDPAPTPGQGEEE
jgi:hypothetical protein